MGRDGIPSSGAFIESPRRQRTRRWFRPSQLKKDGEYPFAQFEP